MDFYIAAIIQGLGYTSMGLGIYISLRIFNIPDITTDGSYTLGGAVTAVCLLLGMHPLLTLLLVIIAGALAGIATGIIHTRLKVNALLAGILVMTALYSVNLSIMGRSNLPLMDVYSVFDFLRVSDNLNIRYFAIIFGFIVLLLIILTWLLKTDFGIAMRATGDNEQMVRSVGINTLWMKIIGLAMANALTAISGYLLVQYQGFADINMGIGIVISGLAAVILGEALTQFNGTKSILFQVIAVVAGSIVFRIVLAFALSMGLNPNYLKLITALIVLMIVAFTRFKKTTS